MMAMLSGAWCWRRSLSAAAWRAATMAKWVVRSVAVMMPEVRCWVGSKPLTAAVLVKRGAWVGAGASGVGGKGAMAVAPGAGGLREAGAGVAVGVDAAEPRTP